MCRGDGGEFGDEAWYQDRTCLGAILLFLSVGIVIAITIGGIALEDEIEIRSQDPDPIFSRARIIPQLFDMNSTRIPSSDIRISEDSDFRIGYCREFPNDGLGEIRALVQMDVAPGGFPMGGVEMRFDIPLIEDTIKESSTLRRCPHPQCSIYDYRTGIGAGGSFYNTYAAFWTLSEITVEREWKLSYPVSCGCSGEMPVRFSCIVTTAGMDSGEYIAGGVSLSFQFMYTVSSVI
jgi:hypothetical protein